MESIEWPGSPSVVKLLFCVTLLSVGVGLLWTTARPATACKGPFARANADRPWRLVGAVVFLFVAVFFVIGMYVLDVKGRPVIYLSYWAIIMGLVIWLCRLALRDLRYTRELVRRWRTEHDPLGGEATRPRLGDDHS